jgi:hypothetical protein
MVFSSFYLFPFRFLPLFWTAFPVVIQGVFLFFIAVDIRNVENSVENVEKGGENTYFSTAKRYESTRGKSYKE